MNEWEYNNSLDLSQTNSCRIGKKMTKANNISRDLKMAEI